MRYGFCQGFSTPLKPDSDFSAIRKVAESGYDYVELPAMGLYALSDEDFAKLAAFLPTAGLACDCACSLFPKEIRITTADADRAAIRAYTEKTFDRLHTLGVKTVVFGSAPARELDENTTPEQGYERIASILKEIIVPLAEKYDLTVVMEPLRAAACNFIHTLADGAKVVNMVNSPRVLLLGDTIHMNSNNDNPEDVFTYAKILRHIHISELDRVLPEDCHSEYVTRVLRNLKAIGYNGTISFETKRGKGEDSLAKALTLLKKQF